MLLDTDMNETKSSSPTHPPSPIPHPLSSITLGFFCILAVIVTYPTAARLADFAVFPTDPLLEAWTLKWDVHSFLTGPAGVLNLWNANIFYPYPNTLAFSEHLLPTAFLLLPFTLLGDTPLVAANLGVLFTTALSGWGVYLLVTWLTGNHRAGLLAGLFFAVSPFRMGHIIQLHLLSTQWIPFAFLALARLIKSNHTLDLILLLVFTNLQFFSVVNYAPLVSVGLAVWAGCYLWAYRRRVSPSLIGRLLVFGGVTFALNWPVLRLYQQVSEQMGIVRSLGDARVYGASMAHYLQPMANSLLYARWLHWPTLLDSAFPGLIVFGLAVAGLVLFLTRTNRMLRKKFSCLTPAVLALGLIVIIGFTLSFGANERAFGEALAPVAARLLPYPYLYNFIPLLQGLRVPLRFALLVTFGLAILAGLGWAELSRRFRTSGKQSALAATLVGALILVEHLPAPFPGEATPYGSPVSARLAALPAEAIILELPYLLHMDRSFMELSRLYQSAGHWRRLVNGASGFKPAWLVKLGLVLDTFPDGRSFDVVRQLGVSYLVLQRDLYEPAAWDNLVALLPGYLPAIESIENVGESLLLQLKPPTCQPDAAHIDVNARTFPVLSFANNGPATFFANPGRVSSVNLGSERRHFLEPLFIAPGQTVTLTVRISWPTSDSAWRVELANLNQTLSPDKPAPGPLLLTPPADRWQPVQIPFANGSVLQAVALDDSVETCGDLKVWLRWTLPAQEDTTARVELVDRFNRVAGSGDVFPPPTSGPITTTHLLSLAETLPPGLYQLRVRLLSPAAAEIAPVGVDGKPLAQPPSLPVVLRPRSGSETTALASQPSQLANGVLFQGVELQRTEFRAGDWVRFTLHWQAPATPPGDFTVFTQLLGPEGRVWGQHDNPPKGGWYPTSLWRPGETVADDYAIRLDPAAPAGKYRLIVGMYDPVTGWRVAVATGSGQGNDFVEVGMIDVHP